MNTRNSAILGVCLLLAGAGPLLANGVIRDGLGAISAARAGTNIANFDNGVILLDNPAGMVNIEGSGLSDLGFDVLVTDIDYADPDNPQGVGAEDKPFPLAQLSYIRKVGEGNWAYGLGVFVPAGFGAEYDMNPPPVFGGVTRYKSLGALVKVLPGVAFRVNERLSVGGTLGLGASHAELEAPFFLQSPGPFQGTPTMLDLQASGATITGSVGLQYQLNECTMFGLSYQEESRFKLDGSAAVAVPAAVVPGLGNSRYDADLDLVWPRSLGIGLLHQPCDHRRLSLDVIWFDWSHAFDKLDLRLSNPTNPAFAALLGPSISDSFPLQWRDSISVRAGYEYFLDPCSVVRCGYAFNSEQIPTATLTPLIPAILEHSFTAGYGWVHGQYNVDLAYQFGFGDIGRVGTSSLIGGDFNNSRVQAQAHWMYLGISRRF